jgi:pimeloyl-ACP methyl ester carboxylesterase
MSKPWKIVTISLLVLVALFLISAGALFGYRAYLHHRNATAMAIASPNGIDEAMYVKIGGIDQWVQIRGQDRENPILLCLHGGPGATWTPLTMLFLPWEKDFTVVQWDQRGAGKTLEATGPAIADTMSVDRMAQDGIELSEYLKNHLHKEKIIILGHSWGSVLGVEMIRRRPDLFYAYVGTGQVADMPASMKSEHEYSLEKARAAGEKKAVSELQAIGSPPYHSMEQFQTHYKWLLHYETPSDREAGTVSLAKLIFGAPNFTLRDNSYRAEGFLSVSNKHLMPEVLTLNPSSLGTDFQLPIFFFQGSDDAVTSASLAKAYFDQINAPQKEYVAMPGGHFAVWSYPDKFLKELDARVRPLATQSSR